MKGLHMAALILLVIGGLNWLLEVFDMSIGYWGLPDMLVKFVYILVGLSAIYVIATHKANCKMCSGSSSGTSGSMPGMVR